MNENERRKVHLMITKEATRIDQALLSELQKIEPSISRSRLKSYFQSNQIIYLDSPLRGSQIFAPGKYEITLHGCHLESPVASASKQGSFLPIVYEDDELLVVNKKSGTPSAPQVSEETETAVGSALAHFPPLSEVGEKKLEPGLVHRLDTETSGLLVFAKTNSEFSRLKELWKIRKIKKFYRALVTSPKALPQLPYTIQFPIAHDSKSQKKMIALVSESIRHFRGKPLNATTHLLSAQKVENPILNHSNLLDLTVEIETGVMHQIRCHLSSMEIPIVGDLTYKGVPSRRIWLHAWKLTIPLDHEKTLSLESKLPDDWPKLSTNP